MLMSILPERLHWAIAGPLLGLLVAGFFMIANQPLGATGAYVETLNFARRRPNAVIWRVWYFVGIALGGLIAVCLKGQGIVKRTGYEVLVEAFSFRGALVAVFFGALVMGYGARMAGGCTSGHGICGTAQRSPASWAATATFMAAAIVTTFILKQFFGVN